MADETTQTAAPSVPAQPAYDTFTTPGGKTCRGMKLIKGKHLDQASRAAGAQASNMRFSMAMAAITVEYDGRWLQLEDLDDLPAGEVMALVGHAMGKVAGSSAVAT